jgi:hypothetical protein
MNTNHIWEKRDAQRTLVREQFQPELLKVLAAHMDSLPPHLKSALKTYSAECGQAVAEVDLPDNAAVNRAKADFIQRFNEATGRDVELANATGRDKGMDDAVAALMAKKEGQERKEKAQAAGRAKSP